MLVLKNESKTEHYNVNINGYNNPVMLLPGHTIPIGLMYNEAGIHVTQIEVPDEQGNDPEVET